METLLQVLCERSVQERTEISWSMERSEQRGLGEYIEISTHTRRLVCLAEQVRVPPFPSLSSSRTDGRTLSPSPHLFIPARQSAGLSAGLRECERSHSDKGSDERSMCALCAETRCSYYKTIL
ncbi:hypothetical protein Q8A67_021172 [Cirrhinus molitorella]|uniref:Uncharacterized protein n=1 Tax=Cirrhinus molitorella TaxID=172907 RepID=A0AA88P323_9TELE|nr:hypothetical protein Q8A67_021172 [Cirrhinus molitorella]